MANQITLSASLSFYDGTADASTLTLASTTDTPSTLHYVRNRLTVTTSEVAIPLGSLLTLGWGMFRNMDATNYLEIRIATGGLKVLKVPAGKTCGPFYFGSQMTAPYAIANTASCEMDYLIVAT